ncbi:MAG: hypothetical protein L0Z62_22500, partial [Gemmataceae bacterium]|nr:hypothetical protein [Gemmataceae bacterium]
FGLLVNQGTIAHTGGGGTLFVGDNTVLSNTGTYDFQGDGPGIRIGGGLSSVFTNTGTVRKSAGTAPEGVTLSVSFFSNANLVEVRSGTLNLASGGTSTGVFLAATDTFLNFSGGLHTVRPGAAFQGTGVLGVTGGTLRVVGSVSAGTVRVTGGVLQVTAGSLFSASTYTQTGGTLVIEVVGPNASDSGRLSVSGQARLGGGLSLRFVGAYRPRLGDQYQVLNFDTRVDTGFAGFDFPAVSGLRFSPNYGNGNLTITVMPA